MPIDSTAPRCQATRVNGEPCRASAQANGLCFGHQPDAATNRAKGGRNRSNAARSLKSLPERLRPVADMLATAMDETYSGVMEPKKAQALASLAGAMVRVVTSGEMEERLRTLEAALAGRSA